MASARGVARDKLVAYLDEYLDVANISDKSPNGLQIQGSATVGKIAYAVDASVQTIRAAVRAKADMLVVHHGLWWGNHEQIVGTMHQRIAGAIDSRRCAGSRVIRRIASPSSRTPRSRT